ncbi:MAG: hypothetical protein A2V83_07410 [Nitrospirae bacterium RBG_16_64_22]|nr:MAG: hypothetical protein A2V83_07410 [Nitrospirae bacterium RBG_16_64_22]
MRALDLGCGRRKQANSIGVDRRPGSDADVIADLDRFPYPFKDGVFTEVTAFHALEHLEDIVGVMEEIHRISAPGAVVYIRSPHYSSPAAFNDPTHRHFFGVFSFDYFTDESLYDFYTRRTFDLLARRISFSPLAQGRRFVPHRWIGVEWLANRFPWFYEKVLAFIVTASEIDIRLRVRK